MQILACCDNSLTIPQYCKSLRMRCSIVRSTWHAFETDSTKMIAQHPRFDLETARMKFHTRGGLRKSQKSSTGFQATHKRSTDENTVFFPRFMWLNQNRVSPQHLARKPILKHTPKTTKEPSSEPIRKQQRRGIERVMPPIIGSFVFSVRWRVTELHRNQR